MKLLTSSQTPSRFVIDAKTEVIALQYGRLVAEMREPGWNFLPCWGRDLKKVSTAQQSISLPNMNVADYNGNPIVASAVVQYTIVDPKKAILSVDNCGLFVKLQAVVVLRQVVAQYPYESDHEHQSLRNNSTNINTQLAETLQALVNGVGCRIDAFRIDELSYAREIASIMLRKQAALSTVSARKMIVESAVGISCDAVSHLQSTGLRVSQEQQADMVVKMMAVICAGKDVVPTLDIN